MMHRYEVVKKDHDDAEAKIEEKKKEREQASEERVRELDEQTAADMALLVSAQQERERLVEQQQRETAVLGRTLTSMLARLREAVAGIELMEATGDAGRAEREATVNGEGKVEEGGWLRQLHAVEEEQAMHACAFVY